MTKSEIASTLKLLQGIGMSYVEAASLCGCNVRVLEQLSVMVMTFHSRHYNVHNLVLKRQSKINWPEELADISKYDDNKSRVYES